MITVPQLFRRRILDNLRYQYKSLRSVVDWTVALYLVVPAVGIAIYQYIQMWRFPPDWLHTLPYPVLLFAFCLFSVSGRQRLYIEEGDALFIRQRDNWFIPMIKRGLLFSLGVQALQSAVFIGIIMPLLIHGYHFSPFSICVMLVILIAFKCSIGTLKEIYSIKWRGFKWFLFWAPTVILSWALLIVSLFWLRNLIWPSMLLAVLFIGALIVLFPLRLRQKGTFYVEVDREYTAKMRLTGLLMLQAMDKPSRVRKRTWLFRSSQRLFRNRTPVNGLTEAWIKHFFRDQNERLLYFQFIMAGIAGVALTPEIIRAVVWIGLACLLTMWIKMNMKEELHASFLQLFLLKEWDKIQAVRKSVFWIALIIFFPISLVAGIVTFGWAGILLGPVAGAALIFITSNIMTFW